MALVNADTIVRGPDGSWNTAGNFARVFNIPVTGGKVQVNDATPIKLPSGETMAAGMVGYRAPAAPSTGRSKTPVPVNGIAVQPVTGARPTAAAPVEDEFNAGAAANIKTLLSQYGLDELVPQVDAWVRQGLSWAEIEVMLRDPSSAPGKVVDRLYPEVRLRREKNLAPVSIADIQNFRTRGREMMRASGVPEGFFDKGDDFTNFIVNDVSLTELKERIGEYESFGAQLAGDPARAGELEAFERYYGVKVTPFEIATLALNPDIALPALRRKTTAVRMDVSAGRAGFGDLSMQEAERLGDVGVTEQQAVQGFGMLADSKELFTALPGMEQAEDTIGRETQLGAVFEGNSAARKRIEDRARKRAAAFAGGGGFSSGQNGFEGVGSSN